MANVAWGDIQAEDVGTTPKKLLDMLQRMRKIMDADEFSCEPMAPFTRGLLDRKIEQVLQKATSARDSGIRG